MCIYQNEKNSNDSYEKEVRSLDFLVFLDKTTKTPIYALVLAIANNNIIGYYSVHKHGKSFLKLDTGCVDIKRRGSYYNSINSKLSNALNKFARKKGYNVIALQGLPDAEEAWKRQGYQRVTKFNLLKYTDSKNSRAKSIQKRRINSYSESIGFCKNKKDGCWMFKDI